MDVLSELAQLGVKRATTLTWTPADIDFDFVDWTPESQTEPTIYAWVDKANRRLLNVGQTGGTFRKRASGYKSWLNGKDKNRNAPINGAWLNCLLGECTSRQVEVWVKPSFADEAARTAEESALIRRLNPILNTKS